MVLLNLNDQDIDSYILKIASKDKSALESLYLTMSTSVYAYALSILKNRADAEDVLQNCFLKIYNAAPTYKSSGKAIGWIMTLTRNLCLEKLRDDKHLVGDIKEDWNSIVDKRSELSIIDKLYINKCMKDLSDEERTIVILHAIAGMKHREIAKHLNLLLPTVLSKYNRAIKKLKNEFLKELKND